MKLLFITQKIHERDDDLAFVLLWIKEFERQGMDVEVICLEKQEYTGTTPVHSLGKEKGYGRFKRTLIFLSYIFRLKYDRVFIHMNPEYATLGGCYWTIRGIPMYLWYTHYQMYLHLRVAGWLCKRMFAATPQSLPQYEGSKKKVILGHGIDLSFWQHGPTTKPPDAPFHLVSVHRICRSKRLELVILALLHLPVEYDLTVYGRDVEKDYYSELVALVKKHGLEQRVHFKGPLPMPELKQVYPRYRLMVNMAMETIDKTMLEGMLYGLYPVTTPGNAKAIGLPLAPDAETPEAVASFILSKQWERYDEAYLKQIVEEKHSLQSLVKQMNTYIKPGV